MSRQEDFSARLRAALAERSMSQSDLARASGLSRDRISYYVNGGAPRPEKRRAILQALGVSPEEFQNQQESEVSQMDAPKVINGRPTFSATELADGRVQVQVSMALPKEAADRVIAACMSALASTTPSLSTG